MRLSEAILLGSTIMKPAKIGEWKDDEGCALQMAVAAAVGLENAPEYMKGRSPSGLRSEWQHAWKLWPWCAQAGIAFKFDQWMNDGKSIDSFVDHVRSIEPAESEEESDGPDPHDMEVETQMELEARNGRSNEREW